MGGKVCQKKKLKNIRSIAIYGIAKFAEHKEGQMFDNVFYLYARFKGSHAGKYYTNNKNYLLEVRVGRFNKRVKIAHIHGYGNQKYPNSEIHYVAKEDFEKSWKVIKDVTQEM